MRFLRRSTDALKRLEDHIITVRHEYAEEKTKLLRDFADHWTKLDEYVVLVDPLHAGSACPVHVPTGGLTLWLDAGAPFQDFIVSRMVEAGARVITKKELPAPVYCEWSPPPDPAESEAILEEILGPKR